MACCGADMPFWRVSELLDDVIRCCHSGVTTLDEALSQRR
jgi:hypothetical protein